MMNLETLHKYKEDGLLRCQTHPTLPLTIWNYTEKVQYEGLWDEVTLSCRGLVTDDNGIVVARPLRYMHTTIEMANKKDVKTAIKLFVKFLKELTPEMINKFNNR